MNESQDIQPDNLEIETSDFVKYFYGNRYLHTLRTFTQI